MQTSPVISRVFTYLLIFGLLSTAACKKDDAEPQDGVQGKWQVSSIKLQPAYIFSGFPVTDYIATLSLIGDTCPQKVTFEFRGDKSVSVTAPDECKSTKENLTSLAGIGAGTTWKNENNKLMLTTGGNTISSDLAVDASTMTLNSQGLLDDGITRQITVSFKRL